MGSLRLVKLMTASQVLISVEEYAALPDSGVPTELVDGDVMALAASGAKHNWVRDEIVWDVKAFLRSHPGGVVLAETEFVTTGRTVRRADAIYFRPGQLTKDVAAHTPLRVVPAVVVEVVSPNDKVSELRRKIAEYHSAGVETVFVIHLDGAGDVVHRDGTTKPNVNELSTPAIPGYRLDLTEIFARLPEWARYDS